MSWDPKEPKAGGFSCLVLHTISERPGYDRGTESLGHGPGRKIPSQEGRLGLWGSLPLMSWALWTLCPFYEMHSCPHTELLARWKQVSVHHNPRFPSPDLALPLQKTKCKLSRTMVLFRANCADQRGASKAKLKACHSLRVMWRGRQLGLGPSRKSSVCNLLVEHARGEGVTSKGPGGIWEAGRYSSPGVAVSFSTPPPPSNPPTPASRTP